MGKCQRRELKSVSTVLQDISSIEDPCVFTKVMNYASHLSSGSMQQDSITI